MPDATLHVASAVVQTRPAEQAAVTAAITGLAGAEVWAAEHGRIVVVLESAQPQGISTALHQIAALQGVLSASLVFEHAEPEGDAA